MEDGTGTQPLLWLWIDWTEQIVSFHEEAGYEKLTFSSVEEKMDYAFAKSSNGFRIQ